MSQTVDDVFKENILHISPRKELNDSNQNLNMSSRSTENEPLLLHSSAPEAETLSKGETDDESNNCSEQDNIEAIEKRCDEKKIAIVGHTMNISKQNLKIFSEDLFELAELNAVEKVVLEGNQLEELPSNFFQLFTNLKWLDLRNNKLLCLPVLGLQHHKFLEVILLENNQITNLPVELGTVQNLKSLNLRNNPIEFPPKEIIEGGVSGIKKYLLQMNSSINEVQSNQNANNKNFNNLEEDREDDENCNNNCELGNKRKVEKAKKSQLYVKLFGEKSPEKNMKKVCKTQSEKYLSDVYGEPISDSVLEEKFKNEFKIAKRKQKLEKQEAVMQSRKNVEVAQNWKDDYKKLQIKKVEEKMLNGGRLDFEVPAEVAPFGTSKENMKMISNDEKTFNKMNREKKIKPSHMSVKMKMQLEKAKLSHEKFLKNKVNEHLDSMKRRAYTSMEPRQVMVTAERDLEIALKLQEEIHKRQRELEFGSTNIPAGLYDN